MSLYEAVIKFEQIYHCQSIVIFGIFFPETTICCRTLCLVNVFQRSPFVFSNFDVIGPQWIIVFNKQRPPPSA